VLSPWPTSRKCTSSVPRAVIDVAVGGGVDVDVGVAVGIGAEVDVAVGVGVKVETVVAVAVGVCAPLTNGRWIVKVPASSTETADSTVRSNTTLLSKRNETPLRRSKLTLVFFGHLGIRPRWPSGQLEGCAHPYPGRVHRNDVGVRNAILQAFSPLALRNDVSGLWANFCIVERLKKANNTGLASNRYFWRTYDKKEIDYIEERDGVLSGFEFKWNPNRSMKVPQEFLATYPGGSIEQVELGLMQSKI
jgi:hypothetical protein